MTKERTLGTKLKDYLIEILIIIIGISISFALNDWEQKKSDSDDYQKYLNQLSQDIKIDSLQMSNDLRAYQRKVKAVDLVFAYHSNFNRDSIALLGQAQNALSNYIEFLPNNNTFQMLSSTGDFKVFANDTLVSELFQLYRYDYAFIEMMCREANQERVQLLKPYLIDQIYFEDKLTFPQVRTDIPTVVQDRRFRNICLDYKESSMAAINAYNRAMQRLQVVSQLIGDELAQLEE